MNLQERLRRTEAYMDPRYPKVWHQPVNPDGPEAADFIDNALEHIGYIVSIAFNYIQDQDVQEEMRRHALAIRSGLR
jgi:hypothetical protein